MLFVYLVYELITKWVSKCGAAVCDDSNVVKVEAGRLGLKVVPGCMVRLRPASTALLTSYHKTKPKTKQIKTKMSLEFGRILGLFKMS